MTPHPFASRLPFAIAPVLKAALLVLACLSAPAQAEKADRDKPMNIEADRMQLDDLKQVTVFTGKVLLTKGTIVVRADRLVLRQDPEGYQYGTAYGSAGKVASFRQKREGVDEYVEGYGDELEYDGKAEIVKLRRNAILKRLDKTRVVDEVCGNLIVYESLTELFTAESGPAGTCNPSGRVKLVIQPRSDLKPAASGAAPAASPVAPPALKPSERPASVK